MAGKYPKQNPYDAKAPQVTISPEDFNAAIADHGIRVLHEKITLCPNFVGNVDSNHHVLDCPVCLGSNFIHFDPQEMWALFGQNQLVKNFFSQGFWDRGTALLTVPSHLESSSTGIYVNYFDRFTLLDFQERFYQLIHKSDGDLDELKYHATDVLYLRTVDKEFQYHKDFELDINGDIVWIGDNRPIYDPVKQLGELFTITYLRNPVYRVVELLHEGRYTQSHFKKPNRETARFPQQMVIKKDFLIEDAEITNNTTIAESVGGIVIPKGPVPGVP